MKKFKKRNIMILIIIACGFLALGLLILNQQTISQEYVESVVEKAMERFNIPAASVKVIVSDEVLYQSTKGYHTIDSEVEINDQNYFHIGSCSKTVLGIISGKLVDNVVVNWNTRLLDVMPELSEKILDEYEHLTLESLLLCKGGIAPFTSGEEMLVFEEQNIKTTKELVEYILTLKPAVNSNDKGATYPFLYSNASYVIAAYMLEQVTGKSYREMVEEVLVQDLGLNVHFGWPNSIDELQPWGHGNFTGSLESFGPDHPYKLHHIIEPSGNLSMTPEDFSELVKMCLNGLKGRDEYLKEETYNRIFLGNQGWSLGAYNESMFGHTYIGMDGTAGTFYCRGLMIPESDLGIAIMINNGSEKAIDWITIQIAKAYYNWWWMIW